MQKAFIETQFPIARLSAESYKERKANIRPNTDRPWEMVGAQTPDPGAGLHPWDADASI